MASFHAPTGDWCGRCMHASVHSHRRCFVGHNRERASTCPVQRCARSFCTACLRPQVRRHGQAQEAENARVKQRPKLPKAIQRQDQRRGRHAAQKLRKHVHHRRAPEAVEHLLAWRVFQACSPWQPQGSQAQAAMSIGLSSRSLQACLNLLTHESARTSGMQFLCGKTGTGKHHGRTKDARGVQCCACVRPTCMQVRLLGRALAWLTTVHRRMVSTSA